MKTTRWLFGSLTSLVVAAYAQITPPGTTGIPQTPLAGLADGNPLAVLAAADPTWQVGRRGQDFAVFEKVTNVSDGTGAVQAQTNSFTLLENGLHYLENGEWKPSQDLIEISPNGAVARHGPNKAIFSSDLNAPAVFDILTSDGQRLRGGVRAIQLTDLASGRSVVLAIVKASAPGELLPPNQLVFRDGFDGLRVDVLYVWKHNSFSQNVILRQRPQLPAGMDPATTRLEVVTEFVEAPVPMINEQVLTQPGGPDVADHVTIAFGSLVAGRGKAFPVAGQNAVNLSAWHPAGDGVPVSKQWHALPDGRMFLVESVAWPEIQPQLRGLLAAATPDKSSASERQVAQGRTWPQRPAALPRRQPVQVVSLRYEPKGFLLDVDLSGSVYAYTFLTGTTYYIANSFWIGPGTAAFQVGSVIKYGLNAGLSVNGQICLVYCKNNTTGPLAAGGASAPYTLQTPVFTSKDDDAFGEQISGSTHNPTYAAYCALWLYYPPGANEVNNARFRWSQRAVEFDSSLGSTLTNTVRDSLIEQCQTGIVAYNCTVSLNNVAKCHVTTPTLQQFGGQFNGTMADSPYCTDRAFLGLRNSDSDPASQRLINPPDTMGAVGPNHFMEVVNQNVAIWSKDGGAYLESTDAATFFGGSANINMADPRILYDQQCGRWVASMLDMGSQNVLLAVSRSSDPRGLTTTWDKYTLQFAEPDYFTDSPTLGVDANGIYVAAYLYQLPKDNPSKWLQKVVPIKKQQGCPVISVSDIKPAIRLNVNATGFKYYFAVQPAVNFDAVGANDIAWFVGKSDPGGSGFGTIKYGRLQWTYTNSDWNAAFWENPWTLELTVQESYYDLDNNFQLAVPQSASAGLTDTPHLVSGSRLQMAIVRNGLLWTCHDLGLDGGHQLYNGGLVDRTACGWFKLKIKSDNTLSINRYDGADYGRFYDTAPTNPYWYYYSSLMVNAAQDMVIGFSGSRADEHIGSFYTGRRANGAMPARPTLIQAGKDYFNHRRWGDYSYTSLDPDGLTFWTIQEYSETRIHPLSATEYGLRIAKISQNP